MGERYVCPRAEQGYVCRTSVGTSQFKADVAVASADQPDRYMAAVMVDGSTYASAPTMEERELVRPQMLARLGWKVIRVWAIDWVNQPQLVTDAIVKALREAASEDCGEGTEVLPKYSFLKNPNRNA